MDYSQEYTPINAYNDSSDSDSDSDSDETDEKTVTYPISDYIYKALVIVLLIVVIYYVYKTHKELLSIYTEI